MIGNYILSTVLPQIYAQNRDPIIDCTARLMDILDQCDVSERSSLFQVFSMVAKTKPQVSGENITMITSEEFLGYLLATKQLYCWKQ